MSSTRRRHSRAWTTRPSSKVVSRCRRLVAFCLHWLRTGATNAIGPTDLRPAMSHASHLSASYDVVLWIEVVVSTSNVVMVLPLYGRTWFLCNKVISAVRPPVVGARPKQHGSNATSVMSYAEVQKLDAGGGGQHDVQQRVRAFVVSYLSMATSSGSCHRGREGELLRPYVELQQRKPHGLHNRSVSNSVPCSIDVSQC